MAGRVISTGGLTSGERVTGTQSLEKAVDILEYIAAAPRPGVTLAECTGILGFSKATTQRMLLTLARRNLLHFDEELGVYSLGMLTAKLGSEYLSRLDTRKAALPVLRDLVTESGETAHLGVLSGTDVVYIELVDSPQPIRIFSKVGDSIPAYATAIGKAILAQLPSDVRQEHLPEVLSGRTSRTITTFEALHLDLAQTRERGYAIDNGENRDGIRGFAAPIYDFTGSVCAALSLAGPTARIDSEETEQRFGAMVGRAARRVSQVLGAPEVLTA
ncbi:IclR family transcriptional regulator [Leucobacter rhizosphaerae]|uniref:IclR family transcriptional regulator n=1 Tax=Leucobacter rhizosphaerae TaxID=2932245 RepID=A0ABY4FS98_9MICO|nr:IclR family transcriptional regulator [Leucobacter rhizosphaerae]UOQ59178.1 IclR family transcriptional regulator [Leucobacter rhizosphaerae]